MGNHTKRMCYLFWVWAVVPLLLLGLLIAYTCSLRISSHLKLNKVCALPSTKSVWHLWGERLNFHPTYHWKLSDTSNHIDIVFKWSHTFLCVVSVGFKVRAVCPQLLLCDNRQSNMWMTLWSEISRQSKQVRGWNPRKKTFRWPQRFRSLTSIELNACHLKNSNFQ